MAVQTTLSRNLDQPSSTSDDLQVPVIPKVDSLVKKDPELSVTSIKSKQSLKDRLQAADKEVQSHFRN